MRKKLYRSTSNKVIGGVCAGMADYFAVDPLVVRLIAVMLLFADGFGFLLYIVAWVMLPVATAEYESSKIESNGTAANIWFKYLPGLLLIGVGCILLARQYFYWFDLGELWPLLLIFVGIGIIVTKMKREGQDHADRMESNPSGEPSASQNGESLV